MQGACHQQAHVNLEGELTNRSVTDLSKSGFRRRSYGGGSLAVKLPGGSRSDDGVVLQDSRDLVEFLASAGTSSADGAERPFGEVHGFAHHVHGSGLTGMPRGHDGFHFAPVVRDGLMNFTVGLAGDSEAEAAGGLLSKGFVDHNDDSCCGLGRIMAVNKLVKKDCCDSRVAIAESADDICA